ncbi:unnamed protein product, partial [Callosobruchus maculatus]
MAEPLHVLLHKGVPWKWGKEQQYALTKAPVLRHYDEKNELKLTCDASPYGVGCVLSQPDENGLYGPVAYHSRTLSSAERNFAQIDREALAVVGGVKKFHDYIYGRRVIIETDHKPLLGILRNHIASPDIISPRMLRWSIILNAYDYDLRHVPGNKISNADALSRLPLKSQERGLTSVADVLMIENVPEQILSAKEIAQETVRDPVMSKVLQWTRRGWPEETNGFPEQFQPYLRRKNEISVYQDCLLWGSRVIIPPGGRKRVMNLLHEGHPGVVKMKA